MFVVPALWPCFGGPPLYEELKYLTYVTHGCQQSSLN